MGEAGVNGGDYGQMDAYGNILAVDPAFAEGEVMAMSPTAPGNVPGQTGLEGSTLPGDIFGTESISPPGGAGAEPGELRQTPTLQKQKDQTREQIKEKRKRRRTLITGEEFGELGFAPVYRRSILGG